MIGAVLICADLIGDATTMVSASAPELKPTAVLTFSDSHHGVFLDATDAKVTVALHNGIA